MILRRSRPRHPKNRPKTAIYHPGLKQIEKEGGHGFEIDTIFFNHKRRTVAVLELKSCDAVVRNNNANALLENVVKALKQCELDEKYLTGSHILDFSGVKEFLENLKSESGNFRQFRISS